MVREDDLPAAFTDEQAREVKVVLADRERLCTSISVLDARLRVMVRDLESELLEVPGCAGLMEALCCLKNQIARRIWRILARAHADVPVSAPTPERSDPAEPHPNGLCPASRLI